mmetsp:Transcript_29754/g.95237  ORF Transcript_29754/g.95237 Transcript_29754/m.95237 type:complete len:222 (-) Transcript_29754:59-724(-)
MLPDVYAPAEPVRPAAQVADHDDSAADGQRAPLRLDGAAVLEPVLGGLRTEPRRPAEAAAAGRLVWLDNGDAPRGRAVRASRVPRKAVPAVCQLRAECRAQVPPSPLGRSRQQRRTLGRVGRRKDGAAAAAAAGRARRFSRVRGQAAAADSRTTGGLRLLIPDGGAQGRVSTGGGAQLDRRGAGAVPRSILWSGQRSWPRPLACGGPSEIFSQSLIHMFRL